MICMRVCVYMSLCVCVCVCMCVCVCVGENIFKIAHGQVGGNFVFCLKAIIILCHAGGP